MQQFGCFYFWNASTIALGCHPDAMVLSPQCQAHYANDFARGITMVCEASESLLSLNGFGSVTS